MSQPAASRCARCGQTRPCFEPKPEWGTVPALLCSPCWSRYADARAARSFIDWADAYTNATDSQLEQILAGAA